MQKQLKLDILCNDGSPLQTHLSDIYGANGRVGLGGAELALHTLCEAWHKSGHRVRLYNNPLHTDQSPYQQFPIDLFVPEDERDILIIFRSPNFRMAEAKGKKIWFSTDQFTIGDFAEFSTKVDKIVTISDFHANYFKDTYGIEDTITIDLPVRVEDYQQEVEKVPNRLIFCSIPDRGLNLLAQYFPAIKSVIPDASLVITSDYRLWGVPGAGNEGHIKNFLGMDDVRFLGAIPRRELIIEQMKAQIQAYPCTYDELFCYAVAECQVAGAYPITSSIGAIKTTNMGTQIDGNPQEYNWGVSFISSIIATLQYKDLHQKQEELREMAIKRFSLDRILGEWERVFNE